MCGRETLSLLTSITVWPTYSTVERRSLTPANCFIGIAICHPADSALATHDSSWRAEDVHVYRITDRDLHNARIPWAESFKIIGLRNLPTLIATIHIGRIDASISDLDVFIRELGPHQNGYNTRGWGWNCGTYVLRITENLIEAGMVRTTLIPQELILEGEVLGAKLEHLMGRDGV
jgi:hypothetical protein